jgi:antirestriction protein ArdC
MLETAGADWTKPWITSAARGHRNATSGKAYRGVNMFLTALSSEANGWTSPYWNTYKGWTTKGHQVAKGARGTQIVFWKRLAITDKATGEHKVIPFARMYTVFNSEQLEGLTFVAEAEPEPPNGVTATLAADKLVVDSGAVIVSRENRAYYSPAVDVINMPPLPNFRSTDGYYATLFHELTHWTGHEARLDRTLKGAFGSSDYAFEELVAELGAALLCAHTGVSTTPREDHAKYINGWLKGLKERPESVWQAFSHAQRALDHLTGVSFNDDDPKPTKAP